MKDKHFPTILGVILLLIILVAGVYLSTKTTTLSSKASGSCQPINSQITNLTYGSFDFSFTTASSCLATLTINNKIYQDSSTVATTHYFKVTNLSPNTSYRFSLISGNTTYSRPEYNLTTTSQPNTPIPASNLAWGRILNSGGNPISGAIVYLTISGSQALSAFSNKDGNWNISFSTSFNENKTDWFNPTTVIDEELIVYSPDGTLTQITNRSDNNDPVPDIIVGQNYFPVTTPTSAPSSSSFTNNSLPSSGPTVALINLSLTSPGEGEAISTLKPDIFGQGPANTTLQLNLDNKSVNVIVGNDGVWHWSPQENLSLGFHKLILTYQNKNITRNFSVTTANNNLSFTSTPSATLAPTLEPTAVPTVRTAKISTTSALPKSGATIPTYFLIILSALLFSVSLYYYRQ